jgi:transcription elongation factor Elf1
VSITCPFCESDEVELVSAWGGQMITSQMRCRACQTYFEAIREELWTTSYDGDPSARPQRGRCC